jgi:opacity protein-like surface antigen
MKSFIWAFIFVSMFYCLSAQAEFFAAPTFGVMNVSKSSGEPGFDSQSVLGVQGFYLKQHLMLGLKYDHVSSPAEEGAIQVKSSKDFLTFQVGARVLLGNITPYGVLGGGPVIQTIQTQTNFESEKNSSVVFAYKFGLGLWAQFADHWALDASASYYPQSFLSGFSYIFSVGYFF